MVINVLIMIRVFILTCYTAHGNLMGYTSFILLPFPDILSDADGIWCCWGNYLWLGIWNFVWVLLLPYLLDGHISLPSFTSTP